MQAARRGCDGKRRRPPLPVLGRALTGEDLLIRGICPECKLGLTAVLAGSSSDSGATVNRTDLTPFLAGVGIALAVILLASSAGK